MRVTKEMLKTKAKYFNSGARHAVVSTHMDLLGIIDVSTPRQEKNGTVVWRLPIKNVDNRNPSYIEVASMKSGYVRNQNSGYSNYQLNKRCETDTQYYPERKYVDGDYKKTGKFLPFSCRGCVMIPNEIDRLEYLIGYCLKNYYVKRANEVADGKYVPKWYHEDMMKRQPKNADQQFKLNELQNKLANSVPKWKYDEAMKLGREQDLALKEEVKRYDNAVQPLEAQLDNKERHYQNLLKSKHANDCLITSMSETLAGRNEEIVDLKAQLSMLQGDLVPEWKYTDAANQARHLDGILASIQKIVNDI